MNTRIAGAAANALAPLGIARPPRRLQPGAWRRAWLGFGLLAAALAAEARPVLRVLAWPGYAPAEVVRSFEQQTGAQVDLSVTTTDEVLWARISANGGADFDVFAVNTAELQRYVAANLIGPIDPAAIPNRRRQLPAFQNVESIAGLTRHTAAGLQILGVPYTFSAMGLIYDRSQLTSAPDSIAALWDPRLRGKVIAYDGGSQNFSLAAQRLGLASPFQIPAAQLAPAVERLIALRRNVLGFYSRPEESVDVFMRHHAALMFANYGRQQVRLLQQAGANVGYVIPREGALAWLDCWVITRAARDRALAHAWIDQMLGPAASAALANQQGLGNTVADGLAASDGQRLLWLEPVEDPARREALWARIRSGDGAARVLAP
ncbi:extracellular solute-binding protein [Immundisolibacter sp.]|uniref:ABC transporter substrate-binding protein n=1 Tax=Immundisolibacter sp. TaxID=1934948 RepID=UPI00263334C6|nr:extracellular solute-binding protein [Immundisolibacter sp.]MDD3650480.1 extracellular solute-binding protein [Immundisolibacter sp.]